jgi:hypothetical protein
LDPTASFSEYRVHGPAPGKAFCIEREAVEKRLQDEETRWEKQTQKLAIAVRRARSD